MTKQLHIDIVMRSKKWATQKNIEKKIVEICEKLIPFLEINKHLKKKTNQLEINISLVSNLQIKKINREFRSKDKATDVLSFPFLDKKSLQNTLPAHIFLGDIVLAFETINNEASKAKKDFYEHLTHLILHSLLHLLGHDHMKAGDAKIMEGLEIEILKKIGIKNPYL